MARLEPPQSGDSALAEAFSYYREKLLRIIKFRLDERLLGRVDEEDVLQDSYIEASRRVDDYLANPSVPVFIWLRQVAIQVLINNQRKHFGPSRNAVLDVSLSRRPNHQTSTISVAAQLVGDLTSPSSALARDEAVAGLRRTLDEMGRMDREVLVLRHFEDLSNNEVAQVLGIDKSAASKRYLRALKRLQTGCFTQSGEGRCHRPIG